MGGKPRAALPVLRVERAGGAGRWAFVRIGPRPPFEDTVVCWADLSRSTGIDLEPGEVGYYAIPKWRKVRAPKP